MTPLCIKLPQKIGHVKYFENNEKTMSFRVNDKELSKNYIEIWKKFAA